MALLLFEVLVLVWLLAFVVLSKVVWLLFGSVELLVSVVLLVVEFDVPFVVAFVLIVLSDVALLLVVLDELAVELLVFVELEPAVLFESVAFVVFELVASLVLLAQESVAALYSVPFMQHIDFRETSE